MSAPKPNKIDRIVDETARLCIASESPITTLSDVLEVVSMNTILTDAEFEEIKGRVIGEIAAVFERDDEPPLTIW